MPALTVEEIPLGSRRMRLFAQVPWELHRADPLWTPPLRGDLLGSRVLGLTGLLTPAHPYHRHAQVTHFVAWRDGEPVGRISAAVNRRYNEYHGTRIGFFGFFDAMEDPQVVTALLDRAGQWARARGMSVLRGPGEYSTAIHERQGVLIDGFEWPPAVELTHNPPYYGPLLEACGCRKATDFYAYRLVVRPVPPPFLAGLAERAARRHGISTRPIEMKRLEEEIRLVIQIYNEAWAQNWGFLPLTDEEAASLADTLRPIADPGLVRFAFVDGEPAAVLGAFPDPYYALRPRHRWYGDSDLVRAGRLMLTRRHIPRTRLMFFGVRPGFRRLGVDALLFKEVFAYGAGRGYTECDMSLLLEDNHLVLRAAEHMGAARYKTWRVYDLDLDGSGATAGPG